MNFVERISLWNSDTVSGFVALFEQGLVAMRMIDLNLLVDATGIARAMPLLKVRKSTTIAMKRFKFTTFRGNTGTCSQKGHFQRINDAICLKTHK